MLQARITLLEGGKRGDRRGVLAGDVACENFICCPQESCAIDRLWHCDLEVIKRAGQIGVNITFHVTIGNAKADALENEKVTKPAQPFPLVWVSGIEPARDDQEQSR